MKVKFIVEKIGEGRVFGITSNPNHVWGNLNKTVGLSDIITQDLKQYPKDSQIDTVINIYQFIVFIRLYSSNKKAKMLFFDAQNEEDNALDFYNSLKKQGADDNLKSKVMECFLNIRNTYDTVLGRAELVLESQ